MESNSKRKRELLSISKRKNKQNDLFWKKRYINIYKEDKGDMLVINKLISDDDMEKKRDLTLKLVEMFLNKKKHFNINESQTLICLINLCQLYNCNDILSSCSNDESINLFKLILKNIFNRKNVELNCTLLINILYDDTQEYITIFLKEHCNLLDLILLGLENISNTFVLGYNMKLVCNLINKKCMQDETDFLRNLVLKIENLLDKKGSVLNIEIIQHCIITTGFIVSLHSSLVNLNEIEITTVILVDLFNKEMSKEDLDINIICSIVKYFGFMIFSEDDKDKCITIILKTVKISRLIKLLQHSNFHIKKYTLWLLINSLVDFENKDCKEWEDEFETLFDILSKLALFEYNSLKESAITCLIYLFKILQPSFIREHFNNNKETLINYFVVALQEDNKNNLKEHLNLLMEALVSTNEFALWIKEDQMLLKGLENIQQTNENNELITEILDKYLN